MLVVDGDRGCLEVVNNVIVYLEVDYGIVF